MKIALIGGHLSPALSVIQALPQDIPVFFIGRKQATDKDHVDSFEYKTISDKGIPFYNLITGRLQRSLSFSTVTSLGRVPRGFSMAYLILRQEKPNLVLSFGGYLSVPVCFAAKMLRIPIIIHEQTLNAGLANKIVSPLARKICISWDSSRRFFPEQKTMLTGNPIRQEILDIAKEKPLKYESPIIYITGGSTGSHSINAAIKDILRELLEKFIVYHQCGNTSGHVSLRELEHIREALPKHLQERYHLEGNFTHSKSAQLMQRADLIISRSGINTITELLYLKKPSLLIPLPSGQLQEQNSNAWLLKHLGLAEILPQSELSPERLLSTIMSMFASIETYQVASNSDYNIRNELAAQKIVEVIKHVATQKQKNYSPS